MAEVQQSPDLPPGEFSCSSGEGMTLEAAAQDDEDGHLPGAEERYQSPDVADPGSDSDGGFATPEGPPSPVAARGLDAPDEDVAFFTSGAAKTDAVPLEKSSPAADDHLEISSEEPQAPCPYVGCTWTGTATAYLEHIVECEHRVTKCPHKGCSWRKPFRLLEEHLLDCEWRHFTCRCGWAGAHRESDAHLRACQGAWREVPAGRRGAQPAANAWVRRSNRPGVVRQRVPVDRAVAYEASLASRRRVQRPMPPAAAREVCGPSFRVAPQRAAPPPGEWSSSEQPASGRRREGSAVAGSAKVQPSVPEDVALRWALQLSEGTQNVAEPSPLQQPSGRRVEIEPDEICAVCLDPLSTGLVASLPRCGHVFHLPCTSTMAGGKKGAGPSCAICRARFVWEDVRPIDLGAISKKAEPKASPSASVTTSAPPPSAPSPTATPANAEAGGAPPSAVEGAAGSKSTATSSADTGGPVLAKSWRAARKDRRFQSIRAIFQECDGDRDGRLTLSELRCFAVETGFDDTDDVWAEEYASLCSDCGVDPALGMHEAAFTQLASDTSEAGCYCDDAELQGILSRLRCTRSWRSSSEHASAATAAPSSAADAKPGSTSLDVAETAQAERAPDRSDDTPEPEPHQAKADAHLEEDAPPPEAEQPEAEAAVPVEDLNESGLPSSSSTQAVAPPPGLEDLAVEEDNSCPGPEILPSPEVLRMNCIRISDAASEDAPKPESTAAAAGNDAPTSSAAPSVELDELVAREADELRTRLDQARRSILDDELSELCLQKLRSLLSNHLLKEHRWVISPFGSVASGFGTTGCDLDVVAHREPGVQAPPSNDKRVMLDLRNRLEGNGFVVKDVVLFARVPVLKMQWCDLDVDLSVNNLAPLRNTRLLKAYSLMHTSVADLGIAVKMWAKDQKVCGAIDGHLSSYAWVLAVLYFLQVACTPALPYLPVNEVRHDSDLDVLLQNRDWKCDASVHTLLHDFFVFYATSFRWGQEVVSVRSGQRQPDASAIKMLRNGRRAGGLHIQDPYESTRDLADVLQKQSEVELRAALAAAAGVPVASVGAAAWQ